MHNAKEIIERMTPRFFDLSYWKDEAAIHCDGKRTRITNSSIKIIDSSFLAFILDIQVKMAYSTWLYESEIQAVV